MYVKSYGTFVTCMSNRTVHLLHVCQIVRYICYMYMSNRTVHLLHVCQIVRYICYMYVKLYGTFVTCMSNRTVHLLHVSQIVRYICEGKPENASASTVRA